LINAVAFQAIGYAVKTSRCGLALPETLLA
jgi:hypothetical protein